MSVGCTQRATTSPRSIRSGGGGRIPRLQPMRRPPVERVRLLAIDPWASSAAWRRRPVGATAAPVSVDPRGAAVARLDPGGRGPVLVEAEAIRADVVAQVHGAEVPGPVRRDRGRCL